jgi:uncharacterized membrane protein YeaQ/YmgE (transglycosylase-associated protein family)
MTSHFRIGVPEAAGLAIVGSTVGALLGGAADGQLDAYGLLGAIIGAALPFAVVLLPRLRRPNGRA